MAIAPESEMRACMRVLSMAILHTRAASWSDNINSERIANLMDAIHNIPDLIQNWETCDPDLLKFVLLVACSPKADPVVMRVN